MAPAPPPPPLIPVLLLKTASTPSDSYHELLSAHGFAPRFVPVLLHRFDDRGLGTLRDALRRRSIGALEDCAWGGLVFTSQRAVEAFASVVEEGRRGDPQWPHLQDTPIYSVGPATTRALSAIQQQPPLQVFGSHTGNGDALAHFILEHYTVRPSTGAPNTTTTTTPRKPLLFLVGEQRRDIIPRTLSDPQLPAAQRIHVAEEVVYGTGVMPSYDADLAAALEDSRAETERWVVVFSPTGCEATLRKLGFLDGGARDGKTFLATIGPTTRNHLLETLGFEPDVCAETPSPEGVLKGITDFQLRRRRRETS